MTTRPETLEDGLNVIRDQARILRTATTHLAASLGGSWAEECGSDTPSPDRGLLNIVDDIIDALASATDSLQRAETVSLSAPVPEAAPDVTDPDSPWP